jgi:hypothetical protein
MSTTDTEDARYQEQATARLSEAHDEFAKQLQLKGIPEERVSALIKDHGDRILVERKLGGPQLEVRLRHGRMFGQAGIKLLADEIAAGERQPAPEPVVRTAEDFRRATESTVHYSI